METTAVNAPYAKISPTAYMTAFQRALSDIPYAREIALETRAEEMAGEWLTQSGEAMGSLPPVALEIRYRAINRALRHRGFNQVLELACGFSPRGLEIAGDGGRYVGTDLPGLGAVAFPVLRRIALSKHIPADRLRYQTADALAADELRRAASFFHGRRFAVCTEGLLQYLGMEEKARLAANIRELLAPAGGSWITPDIAYHELIFESLRGLGADDTLSLEAARRAELIRQRTGRDFRENAFAGEAAARRFFEDAGFEVEALPVHDEQDIPSTMRLLEGSASRAAAPLLYAPRLWILSPRTTPTQHR